LIEVKIGDDLIFVEKKFIKLGEAALEKPAETKPDSKTEMLDEDEDDDDDDDNEDHDDDDDDEDEDFNFDMEDDLVFNDEEEEKEDSQEKMHDEHDEIKQSIEDLNQEVGYLTNALAAGTKPQADLEMLSAKLKKSLSELESIKADMSNTFTSTDTISSTIQSLRGMLDALRKDQMNILAKQ
jgi:hypothetical protein